ncbi:LacI family transcriptional regulator [Acidipila sp. EB88]|nr:LacI family transcriptional regulator [Acidipila sp. EB88]
MLAEYLKLSPSTISFVLNDAPGRSIPEATRQRIREAAEKFNYQPSRIAQSLRGKGMQTIAILLPELGEGYHSQVLSGLGDELLQHNYFYFTVHHRHDQQLINSYPPMLQARGVEGILAIDTHLEAAPMPTVLIAGHTNLAGVPNIGLDHEAGAVQALQHLYDLGHRSIVYMHGQPFSADSDLRWNATMKVAADLGLEVRKELTIYLDKHSNSPEVSYPGIHSLLHHKHTFTAILCFNDVSAMGSIRALHEAGLNVPRDVSIVGFDDIQSAAYQVPSLTTIRQPLQEMGSVAARLLLRKLAGESLSDVVTLRPELIVRESTGPARTLRPDELRAI